ncbi:MAG TPA: hypothetical protein VJ842_15020 [Pyrinomonadaceae bacterium]|nr:hypothetical protein [Pyrinomonadaceae bacterium]
MAAALQQLMPLYFASLFHIGRQWRVSEMAIQSLESASTDRNILGSVRLTKDNLARFRNRQAVMLRETSTESFAGSLRTIYSLGIEHHRSQLRTAQTWWRAWREEVESLKRSVDNYRETSGQRDAERAWPVVIDVIFQTYRPSPLQLSLEQSGVNFKEHIARKPILNQGALSDPLLLLLFAAIIPGRYSGYEHSRHIEYLIHELFRVLRYKPEVQLVLERLRKKYDLDNPFDEYQPMVRAASKELRQLIKENELPDGDASPWLKIWKNSLEEEPSSLEALRPRRLDDAGVIQSFAHSADSTIKRHIDDSIRPGELWKEFVQRLFEYEWISAIVEQIAEANKESTSNVKPWSFDSFIKLIKKVISQLNEVGYTLVMPDEQRCRAVWDKANTEDGLDYNEEW